MVCICLFVGLGYSNNNIKVASAIGIDVNPSITVTINKKEKVLDVTANNDDARIILDGMDLNGSDINVAVNALIGSMLRNGYIDELANSILISVDSKNSAESEKLRQKIVDELNTFINNGNSILVVSQSINSNSDRENLAKEYGISVGKLELIEKLIEKNNLYAYDTLKDLSINELNLLLGSNTQNINTSGNASDKAYIGDDKALEIAYSDANISASDAIASKVEMDYDDGLMVYEVEFYYNNLEYDYEIDAVTGAIIKGASEYDNDNHIINNNASTNSNSQNNNANATENQNTTSVNTTGITSTLADYTSEAQSIQDAINNLSTTTDYREGASIYWEWQGKIETLENKIERYEDELERMYRNNQLSYSDYRTFERNIEDIENVIDKAEETLERKTNYDD